MAKKLKFWNGRGHGKYNKRHLSVAAYSMKHAAEIIAEVCGAPYVNAHEIKTYYSNCWGFKMKEENPDPKEPCLFVEINYQNYVQVYPVK
jgi:hypothetical protein